MAGQRLDPQAAVGDAGEQRAGQALAGDVRRCPGRSPGCGRCARCAAARARSAASTSSPSATCSAPSRVDELAAQRLAEADAGASVISLRRKCGYVAAVDVAGGDLRRRCRSPSVTGSDGAVVGLARRCPRGCRRGRRRARRSGRGWRWGSRGWRACRRRGAGSAACLDQPVGLGGHDVAVVGEPDVERLAAAPQREQEVVGVRRRRWRRWRPSPRSWRRCRGRRRRGRRPRPSRWDTRVGMTLASVVISAASAARSAALRSAKLSTSPFSAAVTYGPALAVDLEAVDRVGVGLGDDADARPAGVAEHERLRRARRPGPGAAGRRPGGRRACAAVLSPSSPISAAAL